MQSTAVKVTPDSVMVPPGQREGSQIGGGRGGQRTGGVTDPIKLKATTMRILSKPPQTIHSLLTDAG